MPRKINQIEAVATLGIDIGKNTFHLIGFDKKGAIVLRQKLSRSQVEARLANMPPCLIGMEACVGAHHLSRQLNAHGHDARRALPHGGAWWPCRALRGLRTHAYCLQLLPQPALPQVPGRRREGMAGRARGRAAAGTLLSCGVHVAGRNPRHRLSEQDGDLRSVVQGLGRDHADDRRRSQASRRPHRLHLGVAHLGLRSRPSPSCAHDCAGWRLFS